MTPTLFQGSPTARQLSRFLFPLGIVAALSCVLAIAVYVFSFFPAQTRLAKATIGYETERQTQVRKQAAWKTQKALVQIWEQLPARKDFTGLGVAIVSLAKTHKVRIPGMGYDIQPSRHKNASKGVISFEAAGRYEAIRKFIYELESSWPHLFIEKLTAERTKKPNEVAFQIKAATFLKTEQDESGRSVKQL